MAFLAAAELDRRASHHILLTTVVPRPIAWVTSLDPAGTVNIAPFSFFNCISSKPPLISIAIGDRRDGTSKDTRRNIETAKEFVVHVVDESHAHHMVETSGDFAPGESKVDVIGMKTTASEKVKVPRLVDAPVAMECRLFDVYLPKGSGTAMMIGEVLGWHIREGLLRPRADGKGESVDVHKLRPVGRLGDDLYCPVRDVFAMKSPRRE